MPTLPEPLYSFSLSETGAYWKIMELTPSSAEARAAILANAYSPTRYFDSREAAAKELIKQLAIRREETVKHFSEVIASIGKACNVDSSTASEQRFPLVADSVESSFTAQVGLPIPNYEYQEVSVSIFDKEGQMVADVLVGIEDVTLEPRISLTTDGNGLGDKNVVVYPMRTASDAVEVDEHNSEMQHQNHKP